MEIFKGATRAAASRRSAKRCNLKSAVACSFTLVDNKADDVGENLGEPKILIVSRVGKSFGRLEEGYLVSAMPAKGIFSGLIPDSLSHS